MVQDLFVIWWTKTQIPKQYGCVAGKWNYETYGGTYCNKI